MTQASPNPMDAMMAFWKDAWARAGQPGAAGTAASATTDPLAWMPTPDQVRRMQSSFLDALSQASDQYMRSPQFLDALKGAMDSGLQMRRQMEEFMRQRMGEALAPTGQGSADVLAALHEMEARLSARIDDLASRLDGDAGDSGPTSTSDRHGGTRPRRSPKA